MSIVVVESPYAGDVKKNLMYARSAIRDCLLRGESPFASHLLYTQVGVLDDSVPSERELGISSGLVFHTIADRVVFYLDYGMSPGMIQAWHSAIRNGTKIEARYLYR